MEVGGGRAVGLRRCPPSVMVKYVEGSRTGHRRSRSNVLRVWAEVWGATQGSCEQILHCLIRTALPNLEDFPNLESFLIWTCYTFLIRIVFSGAVSIRRYHETHALFHICNTNEGVHHWSA